MSPPHWNNSRLVRFRTPRYSRESVQAGQLFASITVGLGWQPDVPDHRDWTRDQLRHKVAEAILAKQSGKPSPSMSRADTALAISELEASIDVNPNLELPSSVDLRLSGWLPPISNQQDTGSCTAHAVAAQVETLSNRLARDPIDLSRMFLYKATRNLLGVSTDMGAHIRTTIKAMRLFGIPPDEHWPFDLASIDVEPDAFHYAYASNYKATKFARLDNDRYTRGKVLQEVKASLCDGYTVAFGFSMFQSTLTPQLAGEIPFPTEKTKLEGGHAVLAVGYDDDLQLQSPNPGALVIQNSWGREWGDRGFGYLPYDYVLREIAADFWIISNTDWVNESLFD
jgi:C1A family cysteine protease